MSALAELEKEFNEYVPRYSILGREWQELLKKKTPPDVREKFLRAFLIRIHEANRKSPWKESEQSIKEWSDDVRRHYGLERFNREDEAKMWARYLADRLCDLFPEGIAVYESIDPLLCAAFHALEEEFDQLWQLWIESTISWDGSPPMSAMIKIIAMAWTIKGIKA